MRRVGEILMDRGDLTVAELTTALDACRRKGGKIGSSLLRLGFVDEPALLEALSEQLRLPGVTTLQLRHTRPEVRGLLTSDFCGRVMAVPFAKAIDVVRVGFVDPYAPGVLVDVRKRVCAPIEPFIATEVGVEEMIAEQRAHEARLERSQNGGAATLRTTGQGGPIAPEQFERLVVEATDPREIGRLIFRLAGAVYETVAVFSVKKGTIKGWLGAGWGWAPDQLAKLTIPEDVDTVFTRAAKTGSYTGVPPNDYANRRIVENLGLEPGGSVDVHPLYLRERPVAFVLGAEHRSYSTVSTEDLKDGLDLASSAIALLLTRNALDN